MPLASSFILSKRKKSEAWVKPIPEGDHVRFEVQLGKCPEEYESYKQGRSAVFKCACCGEVTSDEYVKTEGKAHRLGSQMMAVVAEGNRGRIYITPDETQVITAQTTQPDNFPTGSVPENPRWFSPPAFGMSEYADLFTNRQLTMLSTFCDLVGEAQKKAELDAIKAGLPNDHIQLEDGGMGATAYGQAIGVYLAFVIDKMADYHSALCSWHLTGEKMQHTYGRQALPMIWDYAECNPFCNASGCFDNMVAWVVKCTTEFPASSMGEANQFDAQSNCGLTDIMVSTDPPYYDNIGYADLSDFFYIWMRRSLKETYHKLFSTMLVPKTEELIATPYRHNGSTERAKEFFEDGMLIAMRQLYK